MSLKIKESELKDILAEVTEDLAKAFKLTEDRLSKAEPMQKDGPPGEEMPPEEAPASPPPEGSESASSPAPEAPPEAAPMAPEAGASPEGSDPAAEQASALTPEALQAEYSKLSPEELDMHVKAALAAKAAVMGGAPDAGGPMMPAPDASAPPGPPAPALKAEVQASPERSGKDSIDSIAKSEFEATKKVQSEEIAALKALVKSQAEDIENLAKVTKAVLEQPLRKAVTSVSHLAKSEEKKDLSNLTRSDVTAHLSKKASQPNLAKADRQLINDFFDGKVRVDKLAPLFEDYK